MPPGPPLGLPPPGVIADPRLYGAMPPFVPVMSGAVRPTASSAANPPPPGEEEEEEPPPDETQSLLQLTPETGLLVPPPELQTIIGTREK
jgi:hypothetical protein